MPGAIITRMDADLIAKFDVAVRGTEELRFAAAELLREAPDEAGPVVMVAEALSYRLISQGWEERRTEAGGPFATTDRPMPTRALAIIDDATKEVWAEVAHRSVEPALIARLADLLWETKAGDRPIDDAQRAVDAYLRASEQSDQGGMQDVLAIVRAVELASGIADDSRIDRATAAAIDRLDEALGSDRPQVGTVRSLLRALVTLRRDRRPTKLSELLDVAVEAHAGTAHIAESMLDLKIEHLGGPQPELRRRQILLWKDAADRARAGGRMLMCAHDLEEAYGRAVRHGFVMEAQAIAVELQEIDPDDLELQPITAEFEVTEEQLIGYLEPVLAQPNWQTAFRSFGLSGPPGGTDAQIDAALEEERRLAPLQALVGKTLIGPQSAASIAKPKTDEARFALDRAQHRAFHAASVGVLLYARLLAALPERFERPGRAELTAFFTTDLIASPVADRFARAVELFWDGAYDESAHLIVPRLEAVLRNLARRIGIRIITLPNGARPGGVRGLGDLMTELRSAIPEPWGAYLHNLLVDANGGMNLRNSVAHALRTHVTAGEAALLIQAAAFLGTLEHTENPATAVA